MDPLTTSITLAGPGTDPWAVVPSHAALNLDDWCVLEPATKPADEKKPSTQTPQGYGERLLYNRYLQDAVFGPKELLEGHPESCSHPLSTTATHYLTLAKNYLSSTVYEEVLIPLTSEQTLKGFFFGRYDTQGTTLPFDKNSLTCLVLSGSYAPFAAYVMGIIEGYRNEGVQVLAVDYIGFGENAPLGPPSYSNVLSSAEAALKFLLSRDIFDDRLIIHGYSIGGFPATMLSAKYNTHLALDRVATSTEAIAYAMLTHFNRPGMLLGAACATVAKLAMLGVPFSLQEPLKRLKRKIFVAQEKEPVTESIGALPFVQKLQSENGLSCSGDPILVWLSPHHITSPIQTWTVDGEKFATKLGQPHVDLFGQEQNQAARTAWQFFIKGIHAQKM